MGRRDGREGECRQGPDEQRRQLGVSVGLIGEDLGVFGGGFYGLVGGLGQVVVQHQRLAAAFLDRRRLHGEGVEEFDDLERDVKDASPNHLELDVGCDLFCAGRAWGGGCWSCDFGEGETEFSSDSGPFLGCEIVVLEEEDDGGRAEEGGVGSEELGFPDLRRAGCWWLCGWYVVFWELECAE